MRVADQVQTAFVSELSDVKPIPRGCRSQWPTIRSRPNRHGGLACRMLRIILSASESVVHDTRLDAFRPRGLPGRLVMLVSASLL